MLTDGSPLPRSSAHQNVLDESARVVEQSRALVGRLRRVADDFPTAEERAIAIVERALHGMGATVAVTYRLTDDGESLEAAGATCDVAALPFAGAAVPLTADLPGCEAVRGGSVVRAESRAAALGRFPTLQRTADTLGVEAVIAVPARHMGRLYGALVLGWNAPRTFTPAEIVAVRTLGGRVARALAYARLYYAERAAHAEADRARAEADVARREAEAANRAKDDFLAVVSHELRTPLQAILGFSELLSGEIAGPLAPRQLDYVRRVHTAGGQLLDTIENLLGFARAQAGMEAVTAAPYDVAATVGLVLEIAAPLAERKGLTLRQTGKRHAVGVRGDERKVRQIVTNLVANAIKFTDRGEITVCVVVTGDQCEIVVRDTGIGIPPEQLTRVFEPFVQVASARTRTTGGTGLGLSIVRQLLRVMGGEVRVESTPGSGSTFTVQLPRG